MYRHGFASIPTSQTENDGLILYNAYITAALRCAPPQNKPTRDEMDNCFGFLQQEKEILKMSQRFYVLERLHMMLHASCFQ